MKHFTLVATFCLHTLLIAADVYGHGIPIHVEVDSGNKLVVNHTNLGNEFPPSIIGQVGADNMTFATINPPSLGEITLWELPGFDISGMNNTANLSIEILSRTDHSVFPSPQRTLWFWNPQSQQVQATSAKFHLLGTEGRSATINPATGAAPAPFLLADPISGQQGFHNHDLVTFAIDHSAPDGVYGFYARLTSNQHAASNPFLLIFNYRSNLDAYDQTVYDQTLPAALAINAAAIPGDFNHDGLVTAGDYTLWRSNFGATNVMPFSLGDGNGNGIVDAADYAIWRNNMSSGSGASVSQSASTVPEPLSSTLALFAILSMSLALLIRNPTIIRSSRC